MSKENAVKALEHIVAGYQSLYDGIDNMIIDNEAMGQDTSADLAEQARISARLSHFRGILSDLRAAAQVPNPPSAEDVATIGRMLQEVQNAATVDALLDAGIGEVENILEDMINKAGSVADG